MPGPRATMPRDALWCSVRSIGLPLSRCGTGTTVTLVTDAPAVGPRWLQGWNRRALERHERQDGQRLKALLEGRLKDSANAYSRSMVRLVLIACGLAALLAIIFSTYQALIS